MNPTLAHIEPSQIRALAAKKRPTSIDLGLGEPTLFPQQRFIDAAARETAERGMKYTLNPGDLELRTLIAQHYAYPGMSEGRNVCITGGSQEAMYVAIKTLLDPARDEVLIVRACLYPAYAKIAQLEGIAVRSVGMTGKQSLRLRSGRDRGRAAAVHAADRPRFAFKPTGRVISTQPPRSG